MVHVYAVEAKALKRLAENEKELSCLLYLEALGFVTACVHQNKRALSYSMLFNEVEKDEYEKGLPLRVTGEYDFTSRTLRITTFSFEKRRLVV